MISYKKNGTAFTVLTVLLLTVVLVITSYAAWYTYNRQVQIAASKKCADEALRPTTPTIVPGPDGVPVEMSEGICIGIPVPPSLWELLHGKIIVTGLPHQMILRPYSLTDILFGHYTFGPDLNTPCIQSGTTTDCSQFNHPPSNK